MHDFVDGFDTYTEKLGHTWQADVAFADVNPSDYVALVIPGGRAPEYIRNDEDCLRIVQHFYGDSKPVAQLGHGPLVAAAAGVLKGRKTSAYPALAPDVRAVGGEWVDGDAVVDGNVVSGRAWPDHPSWMRAFMAALKEHAPVQVFPGQAIFRRWLVGCLWYLLRRRWWLPLSAVRMSLRASAAHLQGRRQRRK